MHQKNFFSPFSHVVSSSCYYSCTCSSSSYSCYFLLIFLYTCAHSVSTLISVTFVTFVLAVLLTALAFICCKKYWKEQEGNSSGHGGGNGGFGDEDEETMSRFRSLRDSHFYRLACSSSNAPLVPFSPSFQSNSGTLNSPSVSVAPNATGLDVAAAAVQLLSNQQNSLLLQSYPLLTAYTGHRISSSSNSTSNSTSIGVTSLDSASIVQAAIASYLNSSTVATSESLPPSYPPPPYESHLSIHELADNDTGSNVNSVTTESVPDVVTVSSVECNNSSSTSSSFVTTTNSTTTTTTTVCTGNSNSRTNNGNFLSNRGLNTAVTSNQLDSHNNHRNRLLSQDSATSLQGNHLVFHTNNNNCNTHGTTVGINGIASITGIGTAIANGIESIAPSNGTPSTGRSKPLWRKLSQ